MGAETCMGQERVCAETCMGGRNVYGQKLGRNLHGALVCDMTAATLDRAMLGDVPGVTALGLYMLQMLNNGH